MKPGPERQARPDCGLRIADPGSDLLHQKFRISHSAFRIQGGFTYIALLAAIVIIGITLGSATKYWQNVMARDREEELLFRGEQYRLAIERFYWAIPGRNQYPQSIEELLKDPRTSGGKRYLRHQYKDPITGEDFVEIRDQLSRRIVGVASGSDKEPIKQSNFPDAYRDFEGKKKYSEWKFQYVPQGQAGIQLQQQQLQQQQLQQQRIQQQQLQHGSIGPFQGQSTFH